MTYGTFYGEAGEQQQKRSSLAVVAGATAVVLGLTALIVVAAGSSETTLVNMDKRDGTDALVNAVLVARGDSLPTEFASQELNINPQLPFLGSSAYSDKEAIARGTSLRRQQMKQARMQSLVIDPATQFCADPADCIRDEPYFKSNAIWHQAAHDMMAGPNGPAVPPNLPTGYAWCDFATNPGC
eukprot:CAMPEP_0181310658 /NCGR_PEP_ID=MMETSP1101-20121128/12707_1 /TAXON_ID=46948 /ORGANISM="Rhodomonas abbreviata, Strain Caron Lab Isolate" /LENGTH=183 /DNA_ID=CAMNT_0023417309 /DNA_START=199 /DNA_END=750 /DNA_ORIENTATION=-